MGSPRPAPQPTNSETLFHIARAINRNAEACKVRNPYCQCVAIDALKKMHELGLLNVRGEEIIKWLN